MSRTASDRDASSRRILFGTDEPRPASLPLRAGPLTMALRSGALHDLRWDGLPVWHAVAFPYRDADWWTPPFAAGEVRHEPRRDGFRLDARGAFACVPPLRTSLVVEGHGDGRLSVEAEAVPDGDLPTNRTGLCLLLPTSAAGDRIEVEHDDGRVTRSTIPVLVPPWPPFTGIRAIRHRVAPGLWARCAFAGDSFEFEDQRNNADLSFKVYSRSVMMPRPYVLRAGVPVRQALELWVEGSQRRRRIRRVAASSTAPRPLPRLGLAVPPGGDREVSRRVVAALRPSFLQAGLDAAGLAGAEGRSMVLAGAGLPLRLELTLGDRALAEADLATLRALRPEAVSLFPSRAEDVAALRRALPGVAVGGGTPHFFAQINRLEGLGPVDFLTFTVSPLVHGAEDDEVMACPRAIPGLVATLGQRWPGLPVHLGPSAIAMRASPLGRVPPSDGLSRRAMAGDDPRARGLFGAAWALAMMTRAAAAGVRTLTLMAAEGPSGVASRGAEDIAWHPVSAVLARLGDPAEVVPAPTAPAPGLAALALRREGWRELLLANLRPEPVEVGLAGWAAGARLAVLDEAALLATAPAGGPPPFAPRTAASILTLGPYAVASLAERTRWEEGHA